MKWTSLILGLTLVLAGCANQSGVRSHGTGRYHDDQVKSGVIQVPGYTVESQK